MKRKPSYGGQAVLEGVMMQGPEGKAIACRGSEGKIVLKISQKKLLKEKYPILKLPIIRGFVSFAESMVNGIQDLTWSAAQSGESEEDKLTTKEIVVAVGLAGLLAIGLFVALPVFAANFVREIWGDFGRSLVEGLLRAGLFVGYVAAISRLDDIKRLFAYHGAEHKTIAAYEAGEVLTLENTRPKSPIHPRCGTSFILMTLILMIVIFTFVGRTGPLLRIAIKIILMPLVAGLAYELFRLPVYFPNNPLVKILVAPGLCMQRLTTREPDDAQLEVAIAAMTAVPGFPAEQIAPKPIEEEIPEEGGEEAGEIPDQGGEEAEAEGTEGASPLSQREEDPPELAPAPGSEENQLMEKERKNA